LPHAALRSVHVFGVQAATHWFDALQTLLPEQVPQLTVLQPSKMLPQLAPFAEQLVLGVQPLLPFMCFLMWSKSTRPAVFLATSYASQLTDHVITPRKFGWLAFM